MRRKKRKKKPIPKLEKLITEQPIVKERFFLILDNSEPHECIVCKITDKKPGYQCGFCDWQWQHYACGCECTECGRPGYLEGQCPTCKEAFGPRDAM